MSSQQVPLEQFPQVFGTDIGIKHALPPSDFSPDIHLYLELSSVALGGRVVSVSDDFFAEAFHLLLVEARHPVLTPFRRP
jgi:hypothetical protein